MSYSVVRKPTDNVAFGIAPDAYVCGRGTIYSPDRFPPSACGERFCDSRGMAPGEVAPSIALIDEWCVGGHDDDIFIIDDWGRRGRYYGGGWGHQHGGGGGGWHQGGGGHHGGGGGGGGHHGGGGGRPPGIRP